jgi:hypothetical protein
MAGVVRVQTPVLAVPTQRRTASVEEVNGAAPEVPASMPTRPGRRRSAGGWVRGLSVPFGVTLLAVVLAICGARHSGGVAAGSRPTAQTAPAASRHAALLDRPLPRLGTAMAVEYDDVGDPFVLPVPEGSVPGHATARYVLFWTTDWRSNVPTAVSSDLVHWYRIADALPVLPSWATPNRTMTWAPAAQRVAGGWDLYFSTEDAATRTECIGAAFATDPTGPFVDRSATPLVCQAGIGGSIDPSVVRDVPGGPALVWKNDGNARGATTRIWEQRLSPDGRTLAGGRHALLASDEAWQHGIIEGPAMLADSRGGWWLFYSGGSWESNTYDTGAAWCATPAGPCREAADHPVLSSTADAVSPGGLDTFVASGRLWASYSAFPTRPANVDAALAEDRVLEIAPVLSH